MNFDTGTSITNAIQSFRLTSAGSEYSAFGGLVEGMPAGSDWISIRNTEDISLKEKLAAWESVVLANTMTTITSSIKATSGAPISVKDIISIITNPNNSHIQKTRRKVLFSTADGTRPVGEEGFLHWNGFQVIDMDIKDKELAKKLKQYIFDSLWKCNWFLGVTLSSSGAGLHIYTKISIDSALDGDLRRRKVLYLTNFRHKFSFIYIVCKSYAENTKEFTVDQLKQWMDLHMFRPQQGAFLGYDPYPLINTHFFEDQIYICFDNVEDLGHPELDWVTEPDLQEMFRMETYFNESDEYGSAPTIDIKSIEYELPKDSSSCPRVHYKYQDRWRLANTLTHLARKEFSNSNGVVVDEEGMKNLAFRMLRCVISPEVRDLELRSYINSAARHNKSIDIWAVQRLNKVHGFNIKLETESNGDTSSELSSSVNKVATGTTIHQVPLKYTIKMNKNQYLGDFIGDIKTHIRRITLIEAGPGLGKTEMVKKLVQQGHKVMLVMPFTSTIKSKVEEQTGWYYAYGSRQPDLSVKHGLALTLDKFSKLTNVAIEAAGFDYIFIDESHLLFMSEYRSIMAQVVNIISKSQKPIILMSGTPTGELIFFPSAMHIKIDKEETRKKQVTVNLVTDSTQCSYQICRSIAKDIKEGRRVLFPTNQGMTYSKKIAAGIKWFLENDHQEFRDINVQYYKKSQLGEEFMDDINFKKTIKDIDVLMCTSYLSVGVDISDKQDFTIYFSDLCTAAECDQWANRLRNNNLYINIFVAKNDTDGTPRNIQSYKPLRLKLNDEELMDMHSIIRICNKTINANDSITRYNPIVASFVRNNQYVKFNPDYNIYQLDTTAYKVVMFERMFREYMQQLPVFIRCMQDYGYSWSVYDWGNFSLGSAQLLDSLKNQIDKASEEQTARNAALTEELLDTISGAELDIYREVIQGKYEIRKSDRWEAVSLPDQNIMYVKSAEVFERVIPIFLSINKMFDIEETKQIFEFCRRDNGTYNFAAVNRLRALINLNNAKFNGRLYHFIQQFMEDAYMISDCEKVPHERLVTFINSCADKYASVASGDGVVVARSEYTMKKLKQHFMDLFKCLVKVSRKDKEGNITMERVEILWPTRKEKFIGSDKYIFILSDFFSEKDEQFITSDPEPEQIELQIPENELYNEDRKVHISDPL